MSPPGVSVGRAWKQQQWEEVGGATLFVNSMQCNHSIPCLNVYLALRKMMRLNKMHFSPYSTPSQSSHQTAAQLVFINSIQCSHSICTFHSVAALLKCCNNFSLLLDCTMCNVYVCIARSALPPLTEKGPQSRPCFCATSNLSLAQSHTVIVRIRKWLCISYSVLCIV